MYNNPQNPNMPIYQPPQQRGFDAWLKRQSLRVKLIIFGGAFLIAITLFISVGVSIQTTAVVQPTPTPVVQHTSIPATPKPTSAPKTTATPVPTPTPLPAVTPVPTTGVTGVNGNPWGYDFNPGAVITNPPSSFCSYFNCIASFWQGTGYITECGDQTYSKSGGHTGSCSKHGGDLRTLYQH